MNQASVQHQEPIIKLALPLSMVYVLLQGASSMPWEHASGVINNVHGQVCDQLNPAPEPAPPEDVKAEMDTLAAEVVAVPAVAEAPPVTD